MDHEPQDSLVTSTEDVLIETATTSGLPHLFQKKNVRKKNDKEMDGQFPWLPNFYKQCRSVLGSIDIKQLLNLITAYSGHVSTEVASSYAKPNRASKIKKNMNEVLGFFHNCYTNIKTPLDETVYMEKMSELLTMYMDMEIKSSRRGKESLNKIRSKVISALFIILNNSADFIMDTILKARFTVRSYSEICVPILERVANLPVSQDLSYVRLLLIFKLWKRLVPKGEERNNVNRLAVEKLSPPPHDVLEMVKRGILAKVLPPLPCNKKPALITRFYMTSRFNLRYSIKVNELTTTLDTSRFFDEPLEQDNFLLSGDIQDGNFMESIWSNISDSSYSPSDSTSHNVILEDNLDFPVIHQTKSNLNFSLCSGKNAKKERESKKTKKKAKKEKMELVDLTCTDEQSPFHSLPLDIMNPIELCTNKIKEEEDESCHKYVPSSTVEDDGMSKKVSKTNGSLTKSLISVSNTKLKAGYTIPKIKNILVGKNNNLNHSNRSNSKIISKKCRQTKTSLMFKKFSEITSELKRKETLTSHQVLNTEELIKDSKDIHKKTLSRKDYGKIVISHTETEICGTSKYTLTNKPKLQENINSEEKVASYATYTRNSLEHPITDGNTQDSHETVKESLNLPNMIPKIISPPINKNVNVKEYVENEIGHGITFNRQKGRISNVGTNQSSFTLTDNSLKEIVSEPKVLTCNLENKSSSRTQETSTGIDNKTQFKKNNSVCGSNKKAACGFDLFNYSKQTEQMDNVFQAPTLSSNLLSSIVLKVNSTSKSEANQVISKKDNNNTGFLKNITIDSSKAAKGLKVKTNESNTCTYSQQSESNDNEIELDLFDLALLSDLSEADPKMESSSKPDASKDVNSEDISGKRDNSIVHNSSKATDYQNVETNEFNVLKCVSKIKSAKTDHKFQTSSFVKPKTDYSIDSLLKPLQLILADEEERRKSNLENHKKQGKVCAELGIIASEDPNNFCNSIKHSSVEVETDHDHNSTACNSTNQDCTKSNSAHKDQEKRQPSKRDPRFKVVSKKDLNACLLHKILGVEDSMKNPSSECLLEKSESEKNSSLKDHDKVLKEKSLNQELIIASEKTPVNLPDWKNSSIEINKVSNDKNESSNCAKMKISSREDENRSTYFCNKSGFSSNLQLLPEENKSDKTEYQLQNECDNFNNSYDYESEDSNLVIDEDVDSIKEHNDVDSEEADFANIHTSTPHDRLNNISPHDLSGNICQEIKRKNEISRTSEFVEVGGSNRNLVVEREVFYKDLTLRQQLLSEGSENILNNRSASLPDSCKRENRVALSTSSCVNNVNMILVGNASHINASLYRKDHSDFTESREGEGSSFSPPKMMKVSSLKDHLVNQTHNSKVPSSSVLLQENNSTFLPRKQTENSTFTTGSNQLLLAKRDLSNFQQHQVKRTRYDSVISVNEPTLATKKPSTTSTSHNSNQFASYSQFQTENNKTPLFASDKSLQSFDNSLQVKSSINDEYHDSIKNVESHERLTSVVSKFQDSSVKYLKDEMNVSSYTNVGHVGYLNSNSNNNETYSKNLELVDKHQQVNAEVMFNKSHTHSDPLCLVVKNKDDIRETLCDLEFNVFSVAHEVEICSVSDNVMGGWVSPGSNEIGHPDWPIDNEQSVIDSSSSVSHSPTKDQYLYPSDDSCCPVNENDQNIFTNSLELQQVDCKYSKNIENSIHSRTLQDDYNLCCSQRKFKEFYLSQDVPPAIPVPFPPQSRTDNLKPSVRCVCEQCSVNHRKLLNNYNVLTQFRNLKVKPVTTFSKPSEVSLCDKDQNHEADCSLPLKKRKTLTSSKMNEEPRLMSYPNTPMISIAELELANFERRNQVIVSNPQSHWKDSPDCPEIVQKPISLVQCSSLQQNVPKKQTKPRKRKPSKRRKSTR